MEKRRVLYKGCGCAIITPFTSDHQVACATLEQMTHFHLENQTDALIVCGTTGESATMSIHEQEQAIDTVVQAAKGRIPVIAGVGGNDTAKVQTACRTAKRLGADAVLAVTPYYNKTTQQGLVRHFEAVADASELPVILYNVPGRTAMNLEPATAATLARHENIIGTKEASGNIAQITEIIQRCGDQLPVYSGNDDSTLPVLAVGGAGVISVVANIVPKAMHQLCAAFFDGDIDAARKLQLDLLPLINAMFIEVNPIPVKEAMALMGFEVGDVRLPLVAMQPAHKNALIAAMKTWGLVK